MLSKILVNDLILYRQRSGIGFYVANLLRYLPTAAPEIEVVRLSTTPAGLPLRLLSKVYEMAQKNSSGAQPGSRLKRLAHAMVDTYVGQASRLGSWPLYHEPDTIPLNISSPIVATVHDLSVSLFPEWHPPHRVAKYAANLPQGLARTSFFIADSEATKRDMVRLWRMPPEKIEVVLLAPRPEFRKMSAETTTEAKRKHSLPENYLLFLGTVEPRKNVAGLLRAYSRLSSTLRRKFPLVLVGGFGLGSDEVRALAAKSDVRCLGYVYDEDLVAILSGAFAFIYPSFYEGFGLPPLEAMACDVPVITTHRGSLAEVVEAAALIVDPDREEEIEQAMAQLLENPAVANEYRERGREQVRKFSWEKTAAATAAVYRRVYEKSGA